MLILHQGRGPSIDHSAYVAPTAVVCGDVKVGARTFIGFGVTILAEGGRVEIGDQCIVRENVLIRATPSNPVRIGDYVLVGPHASLLGCAVEDEAFLATNVAIFYGARIGRRAEVRINGVVHVNTFLAPETTVPIGWVAVGNPAQIFPPHEHDRIWAVQKPLDFPKTAYGVDRLPDGSIDMREVTRRVREMLEAHRADQVMK